jgi:hypothetical protein
MARCYWPTSRQLAHDVMNKMTLNEWYDIRDLAKKAKTSTRTMARFLHSFRKKEINLEHKIIRHKDGMSRQSLWRRIS